MGLHVDIDGNLYVADCGNNVVRKIKLSDGAAVTLAVAPVSIEC